MTTGELDSFATWIEELIRRRGFDIDSPRGGGKSRLADEAGVHRAAITRLLQRQSMPDLETTRRLAQVLQVPVRDMLIRSGRLTEEDLPLPSAPAGPAVAGGRPLTLEEAAVALGVPADQREMFVRVAGQFLPDGTAAAAVAAGSRAPRASD
ncbi:MULTISPECIES: helix-turn-helix domain-containing protein [Streptomyces]|uniref:HTH cro/C1-type domain-containing protein n=1 Tax=Streptomyces griseus subsp. griseus (strain JCM 4626 / CBS 651.72 / NBRC 13350 / KCC S-0626 / ISP 5235) TaxID=455632 RepID=B1W421_STRGG|nr:MULTISPECIES: helix-turn-helix transcriptional regulator [Streptomyces]MYR11431.1 helix-turn-helix domain-containing protein [Streptomyces sp. SID724]MYT80649.1 helix-turn-helix domain-containing protein [Streptomyces sp. SID8364]MBW3705316.1 XRE family transcriptional regulator [Streptomyces griseus]SBV00593.1 Helix-turn-helix [Streptomyces sp. MnatMP-M77]SCE61308.1 Helix-turn-helix [Streptomyces sp. OspMP-M43]